MSAVEETRRTTGQLSSQGIRVPTGFAITADAYRHVLATAGVVAELQTLLEHLDPGDISDLNRRHDSGRPTAVAVRSSATAEDLPGASLAGQHESFLNVCGEDPDGAGGRAGAPSRTRDVVREERTTDGSAGNAS